MFRKHTGSSDTACSPGRGHKSTSHRISPTARVIPVEYALGTALNDYRLALIPSHTILHSVTQGIFSKTGQYCQSIPIEKCG